ncbi:MAG: pitrilysin family protein [Bacillota bacterium]|nr:pitrilysin family protein [Bacillota bacterium]
MEKLRLNNGIKLIYNHKDGNLTSFCIGFNAGALVEEENQLGLAHAVEHMVFKGTADKDEYQINSMCDEIFGFNNAMTNFPYAIYYGTTFSDEFDKGLGLYADILLHPAFPEKGFKEEIDIILEELKEWKEDSEQLCEDIMFFNAFKKNRIRERIIGTEESIKSITIEDIKSFYSKFYAPSNCVISVVSSLKLSSILPVIHKYFDEWNSDVNNRHIDKYEKHTEGIFEEEKSGLYGAKIQYCFPINHLNDREIKALRVFNTVFGEGTSSMLFDEIRTKNGLAYDVKTNIKNEKGIKLFTISLGTSSENINKCIDIINAKIEHAKGLKNYFTIGKIEGIAKSLRMKRELQLERSIEMAKHLTTYEIMYSFANNVYEEVNELDGLSEAEIINVINKVFLNPTIQILRPS